MHNVEKIEISRHRNRHADSDTYPRVLPSALRRLQTYDTSSWMVGRYEESVRHTTCADYSRKRVGESGAWSNVFQLRVGDLPIADVFRCEGYEYRRTEPSGKERFLAIRPLDAARGFRDPMYVVEPDRALAYLKRLPIGARFRLLAYEGGCRMYTKTEVIDVGRHLVEVVGNDGHHHYLPGNMLVVADIRQIDE